MRKIIQLTTVGMLLLLFAACSSLKVTTDYDKSVDFTRFKTFAFMKLSVTESISQLNQNRIMNSIQEEMYKKGFTLTETNPEVFINVTAILQDKKSVSANTYGYGGYYRPYYWGAGAAYTTYNVYEYKDGSIIIDIIDAASNQLVWQGIGNKEIDTPSSDPDASISYAVGQIMAGFPPGAAGKGTGDKK